MVSGVIFPKAKQKKVYGYYHLKIYRLLYKNISRIFQCYTKVILGNSNCSQVLRLSYAQ